MKIPIKRNATNFYENLVYIPINGKRGFSYFPEPIIVILFNTYFIF